MKVTNGSPFTTFGVRDLEKGKLWSGYVKNVVVGDTVDVHFNICWIQRVRLVGINAPEIGEEVMRITKITRLDLADKVKKIVKYTYMG